MLTLFITAALYETDGILLTVKPFNLAALKVGEFTCIIILAPFILANSDYTTQTQDIIPISRVL